MDKEIPVGLVIAALALYPMYLMAGREYSLSTKDMERALVEAAYELGKPVRIPDKEHGYKPHPVVVQRAYEILVDKLEGEDVSDGEEGWPAENPTL